MLQSFYTMLSLPHAAIGASIATLVPNPFVSIPLAILSHFVGDKFPHWNPHIDSELKKHGKLTRSTFTLAASDFFISIFFAAILSLRSPDTLQAFNILLCSLAAIFPDVIEAPHYFLNLKLPFVDKLIYHQQRHQNHISFIPGILLQIIVLVICLSILF